MSRFVFICLASAVSGIARADDLPVLVRVVTTDGKPAAAAKVWVYESTGTNETPPEPTPLIADDAGKVTVRGSPNGHPSRQLFARAADGRVGSAAWANARWAELVENHSVELVLIATATKAGRVTTADGKPVAGAVVTPRSYNAEQRGGRGREGPSSWIPLPEWEQPRLAVKTDSDGRFQLAAPTVGYFISYQVKADGFGESNWVASSDVDLDTPLAVPGAISVTMVGLDSAVQKGRHWLLEAEGATAGRGVHLSQWQHGTFDGTARLTIRSVVPGKYVLTAHGHGQFPGVFEKPVPIEVVAGKTADITVKFSPSAKVTGKITDKDGKGVAKVRLLVNFSEGGDLKLSAQFHVITDMEGNYVAYGPAGWYSIWLQPVPDGYAQPAPKTPTGQLVEPCQVAINQSHAFEPITLLNAVKFFGRVELADGKLAAGASVIIGKFDIWPRNGMIKTDKNGHFTIANLAPDDAVAPRIRLGNAVNIPETYDLDKVTGLVTIKLSELNATAFKGRVLDSSGKPLAGAKVELWELFAGVGRNVRLGTVVTTALTSTDANGRYEFAGRCPKDTYNVFVTARGYSDTQSQNVRGVAGQMHDFGDLKLTRSTLAVSGTVVGPEGKPLAGAKVFGVDGPKQFSTLSAIDGSFTLTGFYEGGGFVFARKAGFRVVAIAVTPGSEKPVTVTLAEDDGLPVPPPEISPAHRSALDAMTRHVLRRIWENHATFEYGGNALEDMARIDPATAGRWCDEEKKRSAGKTDFTYLIQRAQRQKTLFDTAKDDPDEALAIIVALKPNDGFDEAKRIGEQILSVDKAKSLRFAEEAVVKARQRELPARIWSLAEAGDLAVRAGGTAGGKKVLAEAAELATKQGADDRGLNAFAVGLVAAHLAPYDWDKAESLLNMLKNPSEFNRHLSSTAAWIAQTDLARAKQLLGRFKPDNTFYSQEARVRVACAIAAKHPDEAVQMVDNLEPGPHRFQGYFRLAALFARTDKARATKMIDIAFDGLDRHPEAFLSWSSLGGRAGFAAVGAARAKEIGYPDVPHLVARCLAMRSTGQDDWTPERRAERVVNLAAVLALIDPAVAKQLLAGIGTPEVLGQRALEQRRDWLFALALAQPEETIALADKLIERAKQSRTGRNAMSETGLVELGDILTAPDRLKMLTLFGSLPQEIDDD